MECQKVGGYQILIYWKEQISPSHAQFAFRLRQPPNARFEPYKDVASALKHDHLALYMNIMKRMTARRGFFIMYKQLMIGFVHFTNFLI